MRKRANSCFRLRPASWDDAQFLLEWRNDPQTRAASVRTDPISPEEHHRWFGGALENENILIFIAEDEGKTPLGTVRAERKTEGWELSWTVAPAARGKGVGTWMVRALVSRLTGRTFARVRHANVASERIARAAGLSYWKRDEQFSYWTKGGGDLSP